MIKKIMWILVFIVSLNQFTFAQNQVEVAMDKGWVTDGKMYVVVVCVLVLLAVLLLFLFSMDRKLKKIERQMTNKI